MEPQTAYETKAVAFGVPLPIAEVKAAGDTWEVSGYVATHDLDLGNDRIEPGAFTKSLASGRRVRFLYGHDSTQVLGTAESLKEDERGLFGRFRISKTQLGQDVHTLLVDGALDSFSIGYLPNTFEIDKKTGVRHLKELSLLECSVVALPMNPQATVSAVKQQELAAAAAAVADAESEAEPAPIDPDDAEVKAEWTAAYINDLPDSAFAVVLGGGEKDGDGKTTPRDLRKLPHHDAGGKLDMPHMRAAMSREPQTDMPAAAHATAHAHLMRHARAEGMDTGGSGGMGGMGGGKALPLLSDLPLSEHAGILQAELAAFVARAQDTLGALAQKERPLTGAKRLTFDELLATFAGLDAVRSDLTKALAAGRTPDTGDRRIALNPLRRRLAQTRERLEREGILAALPPAEPAAEPTPA